MKLLLKVYRWIIISIVLQIAVYMLIDGIYLKNRSNIAQRVKVIPVSTSGNSEDTYAPRELKVGLPAGASGVKISSDSSYIAFLLDNKLNIMDVNQKKVIKTLDNIFMYKEENQTKTLEGGAISVYKWLPDKNTVMYAVSSTSEASPRVQLYTYDVETDNQHIWVTFDENTLSRGSRAADLVISPLTMVTYARIRQPEGRDRLYRIDINNDVYAPVTVSSSALADIGYFTETLVCQQGDTAFGLKTGTGTYIQPVQLPSPMTLLRVAGIQNEGKDRLYAGLLNPERKITEILYGYINESPSSWKSLRLETPANAGELFILDDGSLYQLFTAGKKVTDIIAGTSTTFNGDFLSISGGNIASLNSGSVIIKPLSPKLPGE